MGYGTRNNGQIKTYWPDDDDDTMYISSTETLADILEKCMAKWGDGIQLSDLTIESEYIHTDCLTYDLYDRGDYTEFIVIRRLK